MRCHGCKVDRPWTAENFAPNRRFGGLSKSCWHCYRYDTARRKRLIRERKAEEKPAVEGERRILPNAYLTVGGDWPKGRLFNRGEFHETLKLGYFPAGMVVETQGQRYVVRGTELEAL